MTIRAELMSSDVAEQEDASNAGVDRVDHDVCVASAGPGARGTNGHRESQSQRGDCETCAGDARAGVIQTDTGERRARGRRRDGTLCWPAMIESAVRKEPIRPFAMEYVLAHVGIGVGEEWVV